MTLTNILFLYSQKPDIKGKILFYFVGYLNQGEVETFFQMNKIRRKYTTLFLVDCLICAQRMYLRKKKKAILNIKF